jgi:RNA polymerase sigma-70 factor (ECF subfamily)
MKTSCEIVAPVFEEYRNSLARFIKSRVKDPVESEELLSEVMMKIYKHCEKLEEIRNTEAWLITIARNTVHDYFREHKKFVNEEPQEKMDWEEEHDFIQSLGSCVPLLLNKLPGKYARPLIQYEIEGVSQRDLAKQYNMSESGLKSRVQRGRKMLKSLFTEYCGHLIEQQEECSNCKC